MKVLMEISTFANRCGYFLSSCYKDDIVVNHGDNCWHPENNLLKKGIGNCCTWSCPLGQEAGKSDCEKFGVEYEEAAYIVIDIPEEDYREDCMEIRKNTPQTENTAQIKIEIFVKSNDEFQKFKDDIENGLDGTLAVISRGDIHYELYAENDELNLYKSVKNDDGEYETVDKMYASEYIDDVGDLETFVQKLIKLFL